MFHGVFPMVNPVKIFHIFPGSLALADLERCRSGRPHLRWWPALLLSPLHPRGLSAWRFPSHEPRAILRTLEAGRRRRWRWLGICWDGCGGEIFLFGSCGKVGFRWFFVGLCLVYALLMMACYDALTVLFWPLENRIYMWFLIASVTSVVVSNSANYRGGFTGDGYWCPS